MTPEEKKEYMKKYREDNKERLSANARYYYEHNKERLRAEQKAYYEAHKNDEHFKAVQREANRRYRKAHPDKIKEWRKANRDKWNTYQRERARKQKALEVRV